MKKYEIILSSGIKLVFDAVTRRNYKDFLVFKVNGMKRKLYIPFDKIEFIQEDEPDEIKG